MSAPKSFWYREFLAPPRRWRLDGLKLMQPVTEPGKIANWLGKPKTGIKGLPFEYEYVRL